MAPLLAFYMGGISYAFKTNIYIAVASSQVLCKLIWGRDNSCSVSIVSRVYVETTQMLNTLAVLAEDQGSVPSICMVAHNHPYLWLQGTWCLLTLQHQAFRGYTHIPEGKIHIHIKLKYTFFIKRVYLPSYSSSRCTTNIISLLCGSGDQSQGLYIKEN